MTDSKGLSTLPEAKPPAICPVKSLSSLFKLFNVAISLLNASSLLSFSSHSSSGNYLSVHPVVHRGSFAEQSLPEHPHVTS